MRPGIYDCFTGTVIMMLEDLGFCRKGEGGPFWRPGTSTFGGRIPINTMAACSRTRTPVSRAVSSTSWRWRGSSGTRRTGRQVDGAELALCHSLGGGFATNATVILGTEPRA